MACTTTHRMVWPFGTQKTCAPKLWLVDHTCYGLSKLLKELVEQTTLELLLDLVVVEPLK